MLVAKVGMLERGSRKSSEYKWCSIRMNMQMIIVFEANFARVLF